MRDALAPSLTVADVSARLRLKPDLVRAMIHRGELQAIDVASRRGGRASYRITPEALAAFEAARAVQVQVRTPRTRREPEPGVIQFI